MSREETAGSDRAVTLRGLAVAVMGQAQRVPRRAQSSVVAVAANSGTAMVNSGGLVSGVVRMQWNLFCRCPNGTFWRGVQCCAKTTNVSVIIRVTVSV